MVKYVSTYKKKSVKDLYNDAYAMILCVCVCVVGGGGRFCCLLFFFSDFFL